MIAALGRMKAGPERELVDTYIERASATGRAIGLGPAGEQEIDLAKALSDYPWPIIGAINGAAVGIGATMQLPMDVRIASDHARFGFVFSRRGITPEACSSYFLPRLVGISQALDWCYSGRVFNAQEALDGGLVKAIYPQAELMDAARAWCREIIDNTAPVSVALTRQMMWQMLGADHPMEAHIIDSRAIFERGRTGDAKEGVTSFLEKRKPEYPEKVSDGIAPHYPFYPERKFRWPEKAE